MIRNIIFDWSGTLVNDLPAVLHATNFVLRQAGKPERSLDWFRAEFRLPFTSFYEEHVPGVSLQQIELWFHAGFREVHERIEELPHAREFLEFTRKHSMRCFILSTLHPEHFIVQAKRLGFAGYFEKEYLGAWNKKERIHALIDENRLNPLETLFIGDMQHDIDTAKHGGVHSCAVLTGFNKLEQLRASEPDIIVEHLGELREILERNKMELAPSRKGSGELTPIATVGALIFDSTGRVLMIQTQKWSHLWGIPGGKIKGGEKSEDALRREVKEETNLDIDAIEFVLVQDCIGSQEFYRAAHFLLLNYTCVCANPDAVRLNEEAQAFKWVSIAEALAMPLNQPTRTLIEAVRANRYS